MLIEISAILTSSVADGSEVAVTLELLERVLDVYANDGTTVLGRTIRSLGNRCFKQRC
jgi:hypothetical protein